MQQLGVADFDSAVVAISEGHRAEHPPLRSPFGARCRYIIANAANEQHAKNLAPHRRDRDVFPERETGTRLATPSPRGRARLHGLGVGFGIAKMDPPAEFIGRSMNEQDIPISTPHLIAVSTDNREVIMLLRARDSDWAPATSRGDSIATRNLEH